MIYRSLADVVVIVHLAFIVFVAVGGIMAWRWPMLLWLHVASVAYGAGIVTIGWECPLTPLEKYFRRLGNEQGYEGGFVDRYVEGVIYPERYATLLRFLAATLIAVGWFGLYLRHTRRDRGPTPA